MCNDYLDYLEHYGVKGMKWGVRKKDEPSKNRKQDKKESSEEEQKKSKRHLTERQKKYIKRGAIAVGVVLTAVGARKIKQYRYDMNSEKAALDTPLTFRKKVKNMTIEQDRLCVNRAWTEDIDATTNNCPLCTLAYEMRRRGYDVEANTGLGRTTYKCFDYYKGGRERYKKSEDILKTLNYKINRQYPLDIFIEQENIPAIEKQLAERGKRKKALIEQRIRQVYPNDARGALLTNLMFGGHILNWEKHGDKVTFVDGQIPYGYDQTITLFGAMKAARAVRTDDLELDLDFIKKKRAVRDYHKYAF